MKTLMVAKGVISEFAPLEHLSRPRRTQQATSFRSHGE